MKSNSHHQTFIKVKEEKLLIWFNKLQILCYQSREFHKFFSVINCCSYKTFRILWNFRIFPKINFVPFSFHLFSRKHAKCDDNFRIFSRKVSLAGNPRLLNQLRAGFLLHTWFSNVLLLYVLSSFDHIYSWFVNKRRNHLKTV